MANYSSINAQERVQGGSKVVAYYFFIVLVAAIFFHFLLLKKALFFGSKLFIFFLVLWVLIVCSLFPGIVSIISPLSALAATVFLAVFGGYIIYSITAYHKTRNITPLLLLPAGKSDPQLLLPTVTREPEQKEELLLPDEKTVLEELINSAFQAKEEKNVTLAIERFQRALDSAEDSSIKGMIYTELVFLYRELGKYMEAAKLMEDFMSKNASFLSPALYSQFKRLVNYLQKLNELLIKAEHPNLPFSQVPHLIKLRAEQVLKE
jgi:tetratricopeptide (TPR) repeat protein